MAAVHNMMAASGDGYVTAELTIAANVNNYVLNTAKVANYVPGATRVVLTINAGVSVGSSSTGTSGFTVDASWVARDDITVINNGRILGAGGQGGSASIVSGGTVQSVSVATTPGQPGGTAFAALRAVKVSNNGTIGGGGGGGGACGYTVTVPYGDGQTAQEPYLAVGGGGAGVNPGSAGAGGVSNIQGATNAQPATSTSGGVGANLGNGNFGGRGGDLGQPGGNGSSQPGGAAGNAVVGNANINWLANGTRLGAIV